MYVLQDLKWRLSFKDGEVHLEDCAMIRMQIESLLEWKRWKWGNTGIKLDRLSIFRRKLRGCVKLKLSVLLAT